MSNLITLEEYKDISGITSDTVDDIVTSHLPGVSALVRNYCNREFNSHYEDELVEYHSIKFDIRAVFLREVPIVGVTSVREKVSGEWNELVLDEDYIIDDYLDAIYRVNSSGNFLSFPIGINSVEITYTGGYGNIPEDLKLAVVDLVDYYINNEHNTTKSNLQFTLKTGEEGSKGPSSWPKHVTKTLDLYRNYA